MNLCVVSFQAILLAVLVVQFHYFNEVDAEQQSSYSLGNWFSSIEKKVNIQFEHDAIETEEGASDVTNEKGKMKDVFRKIRKTADELVDIPRRIIHKRTTASTNIVPNVGDIDPSALVNLQELTDFNTVKTFEASDLTYENNDTDRDTPPPEVLEAAKKRRRNRKHRKKNKNAQNRTELSHERFREKEREQMKAEFDHRRFKKDHWKKFSKRKFVKMALKDANSSDSDENFKRGKPVDIIVHIKMND